MKFLAVSLGLLALSTTTHSQQTATVQMQCHDLSASGNFVGSDEVLINGMACRAIKANPPITTAPVGDPATNRGTTNRLEGSEPVAQPINSAAIKAEDPKDEGQLSDNRQLSSGARIVIAPMGGFETYFAAAIREKKVPVRLTLDKNSAQYYVVSTETEWHGFVYGAGGAASWNQNGGNASHGAAASSTRGLEASIMLVDARSKDVVWAYEVHKSSHGALLFGTHAARGQQSLAEACAKHLKKFIEKGK